MAYNDKVVDVTVVLGTQPIDTVGLKPLYLSQFTTFSQNEYVHIQIWMNSLRMVSL